MQLRIRKAREHDYEAICELCEQVDRLHRQRLPHLFRKPDGPVREREYFQELLEDASMAMFVCEAGEALVGLVSVKVLHSVDMALLAPRRYAEVDNLVVDDAHRRRGIGGALMTQAEEWAIKKGATSLELTVFEFNYPAYAMYDSLGYEVISHRMTKSFKTQG